MNRQQILALASLTIVVVGYAGYRGSLKEAAQIPGFAPAEAAAGNPAPPPAVPMPTQAPPPVWALTVMGAPAPAPPADPRTALEQAATLTDLGDAFMRLQAYDLALTAYRNSIKYEPKNFARSKRGAERAAKLLREARRIKVNPAPLRQQPTAVTMAGLGQLPGIPSWGQGLESSLMSEEGERAPTYQQPGSVPGIPY